MYPLTIVAIFCLLSMNIKAQDEVGTEYQPDGTVVKIYPDGDVKLLFSQAKQVQSAYIAKDGTVTTEYRELQDSQNNEEAENELMLPGANFFSVDPKYLDDSSRVDFINARKDYFAYFSQGYQHRQKVFRWQLLSSRIIFLVVVVLVFSGILFAAIQFYAGLKSNNQRGEVTTLEAGSSGLKVSSPVLGIIILVISLAFFYLYLIHIYPIEEIF